MLNSALVTLGRIFLSVIFLVSAYRKATAFDATVDRMAAKGIPFTEAMAVSAIGLETLGALMLISGFRPRLAAFLLVVFLVPVTLLFHPLNDPQQLTQFLKNLAILGGLCVVVATSGSAKRPS